MLTGVHNLNTILLSLERILKIEISAKEVRIISSEAVSRLAQDIGLDDLKNIEELTINAPSDTTRKLVENVLEGIMNQLKSLSFLVNHGLFYAIYPFHLSQVNWLGMDEKTCLTAFQFLSFKTRYDTRNSFYDSLLSAVDKLPIAELKRLIIIMAVFEKIGLEIGVGIIAKYIFISSAEKIQL